MRKINNKLEYLPRGNARYTGLMDSYVCFTEKHQLLSRKTWESFVKVFCEDSDDCNNGWRCEYWGKMMRGACLIYSYHPTEELYSVLEEAIVGLLDTMRPEGRISTYSLENEFHGWDMWGRKYIISGLIHFLGITDNEALKERIIEALTKSADYIVSKIGDGDGKISIFDTSTFWLGVNSCSILEPFIALYELTGKDSYLAFAEYIISTGGCSGGNLMELALEDKLMPYQYPEQKAYETMSFFEGILAYYELTGEEKYLDAVKKFIERVNESDITAIGCSGCTHELFDNSVVRQVEYSDNIMQETCVTVTWIRVLARLLLLTGDLKYSDRIEKAGYNALYGAVNTEGEKGYDMINGRILAPLPFDSYSPLYNGRRGLGTGGLQYMKGGEFYGCCACIASAGIALMPLTAALRYDGGILISGYEKGTIETEAKSGKKITLIADTEYPVRGYYTLSVDCEGEEELEITLRLPSYCTSATLSINGEKEKIEKTVNLCRKWAKGDEITLDFDFSLIGTTLFGKTCYSYGPIVLARDEMKEGKRTDSEFTPLASYKILPTNSGETHRISLDTKEGEIMLFDYASCGKKWRNNLARVSVWLNAKASDEDQS